MAPGRQHALAARIRAAIVSLFLRHAPTGAITGQDVQREDFSIQPGGKGLRFTERIRDRFRRSWLRVRTAKDLATENTEKDEREHGNTPKS